MVPIVKIKNSSIPWDSKIRVRVNDVVLYNGNYFQNTSGINTQPQQEENSGWLFVGSVTPVNQEKLRVLIKADGNALQTLEAEDIGYGLLDNGVFIPFGKFLGGDIQDIENWITNPIEF